MFVNGNTSNESTTNSTIDKINRYFADTPAYNIVDINEEQVEVRLLSGSDSENKEILFRPGTIYPRGSIVEMNQNETIQNWLITDSLYDVISPKAEIRLCNSIIPIPTGEFTIVETGGTDFRGIPITKEVPEIISTPCIIESKIRQNNSSEQAINLPEGWIHVTLNHVEKEFVDIGYEFEMLNSVYQVKDIDYSKSANGEGIITLSMRWRD